MNWFDQTPRYVYFLCIDWRKRLIVQMIIINNPNNPTGALIPTETLSQIVQFAKDRGIVLMSDEVYRPLFHSALESTADLPPPITSFGYDKTIVWLHVQGLGPCWHPNWLGYITRRNHSDQSRPRTRLHNHQCLPSRRPNRHLRIVTFSSRWAVRAKHQASVA